MTERTVTFKNEKKVDAIFMENMTTAIEAANSCSLYKLDQAKRTMPETLISERKMIVFRRKECN